MSDPRLDALAEAARNRGLKLVRSRVRTPGKRRFGKVGLTDASDKAVFGMDSKGPVAAPDAVEDYLRKLETQDWGASLGAEPPKNAKRPTAKRRKTAEESARPVPPPAPPPPKPKPELRDAKPSDTARIVELIKQLDHPIDEATVRNNLTRLKALGELPLVATLGKDVVGLAGRHAMVTVHRPQPVGRLPILVVDAEARGQGIGRMLVGAVEEWCRKQGCAIVEVTSNDRRAEAHAFYRHMGYERTSIRFAKQL